MDTDESEHAVDDEKDPFFLAEQIITNDEEPPVPCTTHIRDLKVDSDIDVPESTPASACGDHGCIPAEPMSQALVNGNVESVGDEVLPRGSDVAHRQKTIDDRLACWRTTLRPWLLLSGT